MNPSFPIPKAKNVLPAFFSLLLTVLLIAPGRSVSAQCLLTPIDLETRVKVSETVFEGKIVESKGFRDDLRGQIHTAYLVKVYKVFKGSVSGEYVVVATEGGRLGNEMTVLRPSLNLGDGQVGTFIASEMPTAHPYGSLPVYQPFGTANGFIRYDVSSNSGSEAFYEYPNIQRDLYPKLMEYSRRQFETLDEWDFLKPKDVKAGNETAKVPNITGFTPASITAGTYSVITINGTGFTTNTGSARLQFANADDGGATFITVDDAYILTWTNTQITAIVPNQAGTGPIRVRDNVGDQTTSATDVTIPYNLIGSLSGANEIRQNNLHDDNENGGYTFHYNNTRGGAGATFNDNAAAKAAFERALETWRCATNVNFNISSTPTAGDFDATDTVNSVSWDHAGGTGFITALGICRSSYSFPGPACSIAPNRPATSDETGVKVSIDLIFRHPVNNTSWTGAGTWNFGPGATTGALVDLESVALHELGHAHELDHVNVAPGSEVMRFAIANATDVRGLSANDIAAGNEVLNRSCDVAGMLGCNRKPHQRIDPTVCATNIDPPAITTCNATASVTTGCAPLAVTFTGTTTGGTPDGITWDVDFTAPTYDQTVFGDNPTHTFTVPGTYVVRMEAGNANSKCADEITIDVQSCNTFQFICDDLDYDTDFNTWDPTTPTANTCFGGNVVGWVNDVTIPTWHVGLAAGPTLNFNTTDGGCGSFGVNNYGAAGSTDRALGMFNDATTRGIVGAEFNNNTGGTINNVDITFTGEQWARYSGAPTVDRLNFQYSTNATAVDDAGATWTDVNALDFTSPQTATLGSVNGNAAGFRTTITANFAITVAPGADFWIRWVDEEQAALATDDELAIDDVTVTVTTTSSVTATISPTAPPTTCNNLLLTATFDPAYTYQWFRDGTPIAGATNNTYDATMDGNYEVEVNNSGCIVTLGPVAVDIDPSCGPITFTCAAPTYTQDFNNNITPTANSCATPGNIAGTWGNLSTIQGWAVEEIGGGTYRFNANDGGCNTGSVYSYGANGATERALGLLYSGSNESVIGAQMQNSSGRAITDLIIDYVGEQWRRGNTTAGAADRLDFQYSLNATAVDDGAATWVDVNQLDFNSPYTGTVTGARDGNLAANQTAINHTITGLNIPNGTTFWIRWRAFNLAPGADDGLAVDDLTVTANTLQPPTNVAIAAGQACPGQAFDMDATPVPTAPETYRWYTVPTGGGSFATGATVTRTEAVAGNYDYYVEAFDPGTGCVSQLARTQGTVNVAAITANVTPTPTASGCGSVNLNVTTGFTGYQWNRDGNPVAGATADNITATVSGSYTVDVSEGPFCTITAGPTTVTVDPNTVGGTVLGGGAECGGINNGVLTLNGQVGNVLFWESSTDNFATVTNIPVTTPFVTYANLTQDTRYRAVVQSGSCPQATSLEALITVSPGTTPGNLSANQFVCSAGNSGTITLSGYFGNIIRWESSTDNFNSVINTIPNTSDTYTFNNLTQTTTFRAIVQAPACPAFPSGYSTVVVQASPNPAGAISGPDTVCQNTTSTYNVSGAPNSYVWDIFPAGPALLPSGQSANIIWNNAPAGDYTITVTPTSGNCTAASSTFNVRLNAVIGNLGPISASAATHCAGAPVTYSIPPATGATSYAWSNPCGWTGNSSTNIITLTAANANPCNISVTATGLCNSRTTSLQVTPEDAPAQPTAISGNTSVCQDTEETYTVPFAPDVVYTWTGVPAGALISGGQGTNAITLNWGAALPGTYTLTVIPAATCGAGPAQSINVMVGAVPANPGVMIGPALVCEGGNGVYNITNVPGVTYDWSVSPTGAGITASGASASVNWLNAGNYTVQARATNSCGSSSPSRFDVTVESGTSASAGPNQTLCGPNTILSGQPAGGNWFCDNCPGSASLTNFGNFAIVRGLEPGLTYDYRYEVAGSVCPSSSDVVSVLNERPEGGVVLGGNVTVCTGTAITLNLNGHSGNILRWEQSTDGVNWSSIANTSATLVRTVTQTTNFRAILGGSNPACGEATSAPALVEVTPGVSASVPQTLYSTCGTSALLQAVRPTNGTGTWTYLNGPDPNTIISTAGGFLGVASLMNAPGTYTFRWSVTGSGVCPGGFVDVQVQKTASAPVANAGVNISTCNSFANLSGNVATPGAGNWTFVSGPSVPTLNPNGNDLNVTGLTLPGNYIFEYTISNPPCGATTDQVIVTRNSIGAAANAGADRIICGQSVSLSGSNPSPGTGSWSFVSGPAVPALSQQGVNGANATGLIQPGNYVFRYTVNNPACGSSSDEVTVTRQQNDAVASVPVSTIELCDQTTATLTADAISSGTGAWSFVSGPATPSQSQLNNVLLLFNLNQPGTYVFRWTVNSNCGTTTADVTINKQTFNATAFAGSDQTLCDANSTLLSGNTPPAGATGTWSYVSGPTLASVATLGNLGSAVNMTDEGVYRFAWTITGQNGCGSSSDVVEITRKNRPTTANAGPSKTICGATATLSGNTPTNGTGQWQFVGGPVAVGLNQFGTTATVTGMTAPGTYSFQWIISNPPCAPSVATTSIQVQPSLDAGILQANAQTVCGGQNTGTIRLSNFTGNILRWESSTDGWNTIQQLGTRNDVYTFNNLTQTTAYRVVVDGGVCGTATSNTVIVTVNPGPGVPNAGPDQAVCGSTTTLVGNAPNAGTAQWRFLGGPVTPNIVSGGTTADISGMNQSGLYVFEYEFTAPGCPAVTDRVIVNVSAGQAVGGQLLGSDVVCGVNNATGTLTLSGHQGNIVRWEMSNNNFQTVQNLAVTGTTYNYGPLNQTMKFRAVVKNGPNCPEVFSTEAEIQVAPVATANAGPDQQICGTSTSLNGTITPATATGVWSFVSGPPAAVPVLTQNGASATADVLIVPGDYVFCLDVDNGACPDSRDCATITASGQTTPGAVSGPTQVCGANNTGTLSLSGQNGQVVRWESTTNGWQNVTTINNTTAQYTFFNLTQTTTFRAVVKSGACAEEVSLDHTVQVTPAASQANAGPDKTICQPNTTLSGNVPTSGTGSWSFVSGPFPATVVPNGAQANVTNMLQPGVYVFQYEINQPGCGASFDEIRVTVSPQPQAGTLTGAREICNQTTLGAVTLLGNTGSVLRWEVSNDNFQNNITTVPNVSTQQPYQNLTETRYFRAVVGSPGCPEVLSNIVAVEVNITEGGVAGPDQTVCAGSNTATVALSGQKGSVVRWETSTNNFASITQVGQSGTSLTLNNLQQTTQVRALLQNGNCPPQFSAPATITVNPVPSNPGTLSRDATVCYGANSGTLILSGFTGQVVRWERSNDNWQTITTINSTSNLLPYFDLKETFSYRAVVLSPGCGEATSNAVTITVSPTSLPGTVDMATTHCGTDPSGQLVLRNSYGAVLGWESSQDGFVSTTNISNTNPVLNYANLTGDTEFRVVVQVPGCPIIRTDPVKITVVPKSVAGNLTGSTTLCGQPNSGVVFLTGNTAPIIRWETSTDSFATKQNINTTTGSFGYSNLTQTTWFRAVVTTPECPEITSNWIKIEVVPSSVAGTIVGDAGVCTGANSGALSLSGFSGNILRWESSTDNFQNNVTTISNTSPLQPYNNLAQNTQYRAVVQTGSCPEVTTAPFEVSPQAAFAGTISAPATVCSGANSGAITLTGNTGSVVRWELSNDNFQNVNTIASTTPSISYTNLTQTTQYRAVVQNSANCPEVVTNVVEITVTPPVALTATTRTDCNGGNIEAVATGGTGFYTYSLAPALTASNNTGVFNGIPAGTYTVAVVDAQNCSASAQVTVSSVLSPVQNVQVSNVTQQTATVTWNAVPSAGTVFYMLHYRRVGSATWTTIPNITANSYFLQGLQNNVNYEAAVAFQCDPLGALSPLSAIVPFSTPASGLCADGIPPVPGNVRVDQITGSSARAQWNQVPDAAGYIVSFGPINQPQSQWQSFAVCNPTTFFPMIQLQPDAIYGVKVQTNCTSCSDPNTQGDVRSPFSPAVEFITAGFRVASALSSPAAVSVYPNPTRGDFSVKFNCENEGTARMLLIDVSGKMVAEYEEGVVGGQNELKISANGLSAGVYLLQLEADGDVRRLKVVIE